MGIPFHPVALPDEEALGVDDAAAEQLRDQIDDAAAADAHAFLPLIANDGKRRLHGILVNGAGLHGAVGGPHTAGDVAALKGGTGGAGTAHQEIPVAEDDLAVGAQVDEQTHLIPVPDAGGQGAGRDVAAYIGADVGRNDHRGQGVGGQLQIPRQQTLPAEEAGDIGLHPHGAGIHTHKQVVHGGIGAHRQPQDAPGGDPGGFAEVGNDGIQGFLEDGVLELFPAPGLALLNDPVDHVRAVADLAVAGGALGQQLSRCQVRQDHGDGGGADVDGAANDGRILRAADLHALEGIASHLTLDTDLEPMLPKSRCQLRHDEEGNLHLLHSQRFLKGPAQALVVGHGIVQGRLLQRNGDGTEVVGKADAALLQLRLALLKNGHLLGTAEVGSLHAGLVGAGNVRDKNRAVALDLTAAGQPPALGVFLVGDVTAPGRLQLSLHQLHTALATGAVAGARRVNGHIGPPRQLQKIVTGVAFNHNRAFALDLEGYFHSRKFLSDRK